MNSLKANLKPLETFVSVFCFVTVMLSLVLLLSFSPSAHAGHASVPETPDLQQPYDSGHSGSDNITNSTLMTFSTCSLILSEIQTLRLVRVPHGNAVGTGEVNIGATEGITSGANANCPTVGSGRRTVTFFGRTLPEGDWDVYVKAVGQGEGFTNDSVVSGSIRVRVDRTAPTFVKATRVSDNAIDYYLTEGLRALRPANFNETLGATFTFDPTLAGSNILTATSTATERDANFFRINFSEAYATIASGVGKEISIDYATGSFNSLRAAFTDEAGNELVDHSDSAVNYVPAIEAITLDQSGSHTIRVSDPNTGDTLSAEWIYVDAASNCGVRDYGDSVTGTSFTLTGTNNILQTGTVTYDGSVAANVNRHVCVKVSDSLDVTYSTSTNTVAANTNPTITIDDVEGDNIVNANETPADISGTSINIAQGQTIAVSFDNSIITTQNVTVGSDGSWSGVSIPAVQQADAISVSSTIVVTATHGTTTASKTFSYDLTRPALATEIPNQRASTGTDFEFQIPPGTFTDTDTLTYTSTGQGNGIEFNTATNTWEGTPTTEEIQTIIVTATDPVGNTQTDTFTITISAPGSTPTDITLSNNTVAENITAVGTFSTTDEVGDTHTYELVAGTGAEDNGKFTITGNAIAFNSAPNFESPDDAGDTANNNTYAIRVKTVDQDNEEFTKEFIITVEDVVEVVNFTIDAIADVSVSEGVVYTSVTPSLSGGTPIGTVTYASSGDAPIGSSIDTGTGVVSFPSLDFESPEDADTSNDYVVTITATDEDGNTATQNWTISVTDYLELGGIEINPLLWVKANDGITENSSNVITGWTDRSPSSEVATAAGNPVLSSSFINFNPSVAFDGTNDHFEFNIPSIIRSRNNFTFIAVAGSNDTSSLSHQHILGTNQSDGVRITLRGGRIALHKTNAGDIILHPDPGIVENDIGIVAVSRSGSNGNDFASYQNGAENTTTSTDNRYTFAGDATSTYIGRESGSGGRLNGQLAELIVFEDVLSADDLDKVQTNLAIKYGITLHSDVDYLNSSGDSVFDNSGTYTNDIVGIAKDDTSILDQRISKSKNTGAILTISTDSTFTGVNSGHASLPTDGQYLVIGNDGEATTIQSTETPGSTTNRITREWKVENTGSVGEVNLKFDGLDDTYTLYTDADGDFSAGATEGRALNANGEIAATLTDGIYFTLSTTTSPNTAPTDITLTLTNTTVDENQTVVGTFSTTDSVGDRHTYLLEPTGTGNEDNAKFTLTEGGELSFKTANTPNHESPTDLGDTANNNTYAIRVKTTDQGGEEYTKEFIITVEDVDENDANLTNLEVEGATLAETFEVDTVVYTSTVDSTVTSVTVTPTVSHPDAIIRIGGNVATSGSETTVTLSNGANAIAVAVTAEDGTTTKTYTINITKTSTATILINTIITDGYVNAADDDTDIAISGTSVNINNAETITLTITDSGSGSVTKSPEVTSNNWSTTLTSSDIQGLAEGTITVTASYTGATPVIQTFEYDRTVPTITVAITHATDNVGDVTDDLSSGDTTDDDTPTFVGTISAALGTGESVAVYEGSALLGTATINGTAWGYQPSAIAEGAKTFSAKVVDTAGNEGTLSSTFSLTIDTTAPVLADDIDDQTATVGTDFSFQIPSGTFTDTNALTYTSSALTNGLSFATDTWSAVGSSLIAGTVTVIVTATDPAGLTVTDEFDIEISAAATGSPNPAPTTPTISINTIVADGYVNNADDESDITTRGASTDIANAETITFEIADSDTSDSTDIARIPVVGSDGTWSTILTSENIKELAEGTITVTASYTGATPATQTFIYDTTAPTVSVARTGTDRRQTDTIVIGINENLAGTATTTDFTISYEGVTDANPSSVSLENGNINIRVSTEIERGDNSITVSYSGSTITDTAGNALAAISNQTVENRVRSSGGGGGGGTVFLSGGGTGSIAPVVPDQYGPVAPVEQVQVSLPTTAPMVQRQANLQFKRDLSVETRGDDVKELQEFLNNNGFPVSNSGVGSKGQETNYFGPATKKALAEYQETNDIPATGYLGEQTRQSIQKSIVINEIVRNIVSIQNRIKELQEREASSNIPTNAERVDTPDSYYNTIINTIPIAPPQHRALNAPMVDYFAQPQQSSEPQEEAQQEEQSNAPTQNGAFYNMFSGQSKEKNMFRNYLSAPTL